MQALSSKVGRTTDEAHDAGMERRLHLCLVIGEYHLNVRVTLRHANYQARLGTALSIQNAVYYRVGQLPRIHILPLQIG
jgi:hypothetical protein